MDNKLYRMTVTEVVENRVHYYVAANNLDHAACMIDEGETIAEVFDRTDTVRERHFRRDTLTEADPVNWEAVARANGWDRQEFECVSGIGTVSSEFILHHEGLERTWPDMDWRGACTDVGLME